MRSRTLPDDDSRSVITPKASSWQWKITREQRAGFAERCPAFAQSI